MRRKSAIAALAIVALATISRAFDEPATPEELVKLFERAEIAGDWETVGALFGPPFGPAYLAQCRAAVRVGKAKRAVIDAMNATFPCQHEDELSGEDDARIVAAMKRTVSVTLESKKPDGDRFDLRLVVFERETPDSQPISHVDQLVAAKKNGAWRFFPGGANAHVDPGRIGSARLDELADEYERLAREIVAKKFKHRDDAIAEAASRHEWVEKIPVTELLQRRDFPETIELKRQFESLVAAEKSGDRASIAAAAKSLALDDADAWFGAALGEERTAAAIADFRAEAKTLDLDRFLAHAVAKGWTDVRIVRIAGLDAMKKKTPLYTVRLHEPNETPGESLFFLARVGDRFVFVGKLAKLTGR